VWKNSIYKAFFKLVQIVERDFTHVRAHIANKYSSRSAPYAYYGEQSSICSQTVARIGGIRPHCSSNLFEALDIDELVAQYEYGQRTNLAHLYQIVKALKDNFHLVCKTLFGEALSGTSAAGGHARVI